MKFQNPEKKGIVEITEETLPFYFGRSGNSFVTVICFGQYAGSEVKFTLIFKYPDGRRNSQVYTLSDSKDFFGEFQDVFMRTVITQKTFFGRTPAIMEKDLRGKSYDDISDWLTTTPNLFDHYIKKES